jgi:hypothetical protein
MVYYIWIQNDGNGGNGKKKADQGYVAWTQLVVELYDHFDSDIDHLDRLTKLKKSETVEKFFVAIEHWDFRTEGMSDAFFRECLVNFWISGWTLCWKLYNVY